MLRGRRSAMATRGARQAAAEAGAAMLQRAQRGSGPQQGMRLGPLMHQSGVAPLQRHVNASQGMLKPTGDEEAGRVDDACLLQACQVLRLLQVVNLQQRPVDGEMSRQKRQAAARGNGARWETERHRAWQAHGFTRDRRRLRHIGGSRLQDRHAPPDLAVQNRAGSSKRTLVQEAGRRSQALWPWTTHLAALKPACALTSTQGAHTGMRAPNTGRALAAACPPPKLSSRRQRANACEDKAAAHLVVVGSRQVGHQGALAADDAGGAGAGRGALVHHVVRLHGTAGTAWPSRPSRHAVGQAGSRPWRERGRGPAGPEVRPQRGAGQALNPARACVSSASHISGELHGRALCHAKPRHQGWGRGQAKRAHSRAGRQQGRARANRQHIGSVWDGVGGRADARAARGMGRRLGASSGTSPSRRPWPPPSAAPQRNGPCPRSQSRW